MVFNPRQGRGPVFITRGTRHDRDEIRQLLTGEGWDTDRMEEGTTLIARDGPIAGCVRLVEVEPRTVVLDDVLVRPDRRGQGLGRQLVQAAMNNRGGTLFLCCHKDALGFYEKLGFSEVPFDDLPAPVKEYMVRAGDHPTDPGHEHFFLKAR